MHRQKLENPLFLGVDGGGSKCRAIITNAEGVLLGEGLGGPANPFHGIDRSLDSIRTATNAALQSAGMAETDSQKLIACVGLAGVNLPAMHRQLSAWQHPYADLVVAWDLHVACLGAHQGQDGAVIICGTGSVGYSTVKGQNLALGGYGFPHGDQGSGGWTGLQAVTAAFRALDGLAEPTALSARVLEKLGASEPLAAVEILSAQGVRSYAQLAPLVYELANAGDATAIRIVREGAAYISQMARRLLACQPPRLSMIGGLAPIIQPWLDSDVAPQVAPPLEQPEMGAVREAMRHWHSAAAH